MRCSHGCQPMERGPITRFKRQRGDTRHRVTNTCRPVGQRREGFEYVRSSEPPPHPAYRPPSPPPRGRRSSANALKYAAINPSRRCPLGLVPNADAHHGLAPVATLCRPVGTESRRGTDMRFSHGAAAGCRHRRHGANRSFFRRNESEWEVCFQSLVLLNDPDFLSKSAHRRTSERRVPLDCRASCPGSMTRYQDTSPWLPSTAASVSA